MEISEISTASTRELVELVIGRHSRAELANKLGVNSPRTIGYWMEGKEPRKDARQKLEKLAGEELKRVGANELNAGNVRIGICSQRELVNSQKKARVAHAIVKILYGRETLPEKVLLLDGTSISAVGTALSERMFLEREENPGFVIGTNNPGVFEKWEKWRERGEVTNPVVTELPSKSRYSDYYNCFYAAGDDEKCADSSGWLKMQCEEAQVTVLAVTSIHPIYGPLAKTGGASRETADFIKDAKEIALRYSQDLVIAADSTKFRAIEQNGNGENPTEPVNQNAWEKRVKKNSIWVVTDPLKDEKLAKMWREQLGDQFVVVEDEIKWLYEQHAAYSGLLNRYSDRDSEPFANARRKVRDCQERIDKIQVTW